MKPYFLLLTFFLLGVRLQAQAGVESRCVTTCLDSALYRPGRWGVDFLASQDFPTLGVFRLMTARTAWIADVSGLAQKTPAANAVTPGQQRPETHTTVLRASLGLRRYYAIAMRSVALAGIGGTVDWTRLTVDGISESLQSYSAGPYLEAGAQYQLASQIALGVNVRLRAVWGSTRVGLIDNFGRVVTESRPESLVELEPARLALSIFF